MDDFGSVVAVRPLFNNQNLEIPIGFRESSCYYAASKTTFERFQSIKVSVELGIELY
jgi:hypothetical protein